jgi:Kef-type K+ transport system membrane component KefB
MPREEAAAALREEILNRLEQVSVLVLLPVFFVVSGLSVNLSSVGPSGLAELCLSCWSLSSASSSAPSPAPVSRESVAGMPGSLPP